MDQQVAELLPVCFSERETQSKKMTAGGNADGKRSEKGTEGEEGFRIVESLRGRLLAERVASRVANEESEQMGNKLVELEKQLNVEIKSRNRAEKKLKFLMKKLQSLKITYISDDSEHSTTLERSDMSSVSSTASSVAKEPEDKDPKAQTAISTKCESESTRIENTKCPIGSNLKHNAPQTTISNNSDQCHYSPMEATLSGTSDVNSDKERELESSQNYDDLKREEHSSKSSIEEENGRENDRDEESGADDSLALVPVDLPVESRRVEPPPIVVDASVRDVLEALRHAREMLKSSIMERRHGIKVGSR